jgi:hypothetical protein
MVLGMNALAKTQGTGTPAQFNWVQWSRRNAVVKAITNIALDYGIAVIRKRADTVINRVLNWGAVV